MDSRPDTAYQPAKVDPSDLRRPVTRNQRVMPDAEIKRLREQRLDQEESFKRLSPRTLRRMQLYPIGAAVALPIVYGFILPIGFSIFHLPLYATFGIYVAFMRPMRTHSVLAFAFLTIVTYGTATTRGALTQFNVFYIVLAVVCIGMAIGMAEEQKLSM